MSWMIGKKQEKAIEIMREKNRIYLEDYRSATAAKQEKTDGEETPYAFRSESAVMDDEHNLIPETDKENEEIEFEKGDLTAIILSALIVFWPLILFFGILLVLVIHWSWKG